MGKTQNTYLPENILIPFFGLKEPIIGVEIGILGGSGSISMLNRMPNLKLYCIDPWKHFEGHGYEAENSQDYHDKNYEETKRRLKEFGNRVIILRMTSDEALNFVKEKVDFVWIDGSHQEHQVQKDIQNYSKKLKSVSIIGGHDWWLDHVKRVVYKELGKNIKLGEDGTWYKIYEKRN